MSDNNYNFSEIEERWRKIWDEKPDQRAKDFDRKPKFYNLNEFPYPSGTGLHMGHCMGWTASDVYSRMKRMQGYNVLFPVGWDSFGLPTENYAIKMGKKPSDVTRENTDFFRKQMKALAYSVDWDREINTTDPNYYKWTQWIFLQFYKHAILNNKLVEVADDDKITPRLAFQAKMPINWCSSCKIGLANEEVVAGKCERCGTEVVKKTQKQWMLRITAYAERLLKDLDTVNFPNNVKTAQVNWIGKSTGSNIVFRIQNTDYNIEVFTTRADTLFGCTYVVLAPEHPLLENLKFKIKNLKNVKEYIENTKKKSDLERTDLAKDKTGVKLEGIKAINPTNNEEIDVYVADYVLANYGTGAVMAVPAHDDRDFEFAIKYNIPIKQVIGSRKEEERIQNTAFCDYGILINSGEFDGLTSEEAKKKITEKLKSIGSGDFTVNYKLRDWIFSRQHYWGEPIPIIHCNKCGMVPVNESDLPLTLPEVESYEPTNSGESPLANIDSWVNVKCPKCGGEAKRETDTMPNWAGSSWYFLRYCDPSNDKEFASKGKLKYWTPVDLYNGGNEHTTLHLLYSRFWHKFLYDLEFVPTLEPYQKRIAHGIILGADGQKMSKSKGNTVIPDEIVAKFGADTTRAYIMFIGPYDQESAWSTAGVQGIYRFLNRIYTGFNKINFSNEDSNELLVKLNQTIDGVSQDMEAFRMNTVVSKLMELNNVIEKQKSITKESYKQFVKMLSPVVPFLSSEIWNKLDSKKLLQEDSWPEVDKNYLVAEKIEVVVQVNGKVRDHIEVDAGISDEELKKTALESGKVLEYIKDKEIVKTIVVPKKLVSIVLKNI